jgi:hypothetical protein
VTSAAAQSAAAKITDRIAQLADWRGEMLAHVRRLILDADPGMIEEWKWEKPTSGGVPVWSHDGIVCTGETYKQVVKLTLRARRRCPTRRSCSMRAWKGMCDGRSICARGWRSMKRRFGG